MIQNIGIMMTRNEADVIDEVMTELKKYFTQILVLDGSSDGTDEIIRSYDNVKYFIKDSELPYEGRVKDGARQFLLSKAQEMFGYDGWFTILHGDEIFYDNPNKIIELAESQKAERVNWQPMNFYLHESDKHRDLLSIKSVQERVLWYSPAQFLEIRQFKNKKGIFYNKNRHSVVVPDGVGVLPLLYFPIYKHYPCRSPLQMIEKNKEGKKIGFFSPTFVGKESVDACFSEKWGKINRKFDGSFHEFEMPCQMKPWEFVKRVFLRSLFL